MFDLRFYAMIFLRRLPLFLIVSGLIAGIAIVSAITLPPAYVSRVQVIVESSQIPGNLAQSTVRVTPREQLQLFETRLLTRANLLEIAQRVQALPDMSTMSPDQIVAAMRARTTIRTSSARDAVTLMTLTFEAYSASKAAAVLNEYLTILLREDAEFRSSRAGSTQDFFEQEVERLSNGLAEKSGAIVSFKNENVDALPDSLNYRRQQQSSNASRLAQIERELSNLEEQRTRLVEVYKSSGSVANSGVTTTTAPTSPLARRIQDLELQMSDLLTVYNQDSPRVVVVRDRIANLRAQMTAATAAIPDSSEPEQPAKATSPGETILNLQLAEIDSKVEILLADQTRLSALQDELTDSISRTPANAVTLESLTRDYSNIQRQYDTAVDRLSKASTGERIETLSRGQRISVVEQPTVPSRPTKPNRVLIAGGGTGFGIVLATLLVAVIEIFNRTVRRPVDLVNSLGITPLATIPYIRSDREMNRGRIRRILVIFVVIVGVPAALYAMHTYYMPIDQIAEKIMNKIGIRG